MDSVSHSIGIRNREVIETLLEQIMCEHNWYKEGHGFKCTCCHYYTGLNTELNALIHDQLKTEIKSVKCPDCVNGTKCFIRCEGVNNFVSWPKCETCNGTGFIHEV